MTCYLHGVRALVLAVPAALLAGCFGGCISPGGDTCQRDVECGASEVCANTRVCVADGTTQAVTIRWTVRGAPASAAGCAPIPELAVGVHVDGTGDFHEYAPVLCATGRFHFDKLPVAFDLATLAVLGGAESHAAPITGPGEVWFDLSSGIGAVDAAVVPDAAQLPDAGVPDAAP